MTTALAKWVAKRIFGETVKNHFGKDDPYFETVPASELKQGKKPSKRGKKRPKAMPPGISEHDAKVLTKARRRAYILDTSLIDFCGIRFGWSSVIAIVPVIGDALDAFMASMVIRTCSKVEGGLPQSVRGQMLFNVALDFLVGLVPLIGDVADAAYHANTRNVVVLEKYLVAKGKKNLAASGGEEGLRTSRRKTDRIDDDEDELAMGRREGTGRVSPPRAGERVEKVQKPLPAKTKNGAGWFSSGRKSTARPARDDVVEPDHEVGGMQEGGVTVPMGDTSRRTVPA